jgi:multicomponent Na+:H+ antiporter subunit F
MIAFLLTAAVLVLGMVAIALARLLRGRQPLDWLMAAQLLGTAGIAALLLVGTATAASGALDLALLLALLAAFATMAFAASVRTRAERARESAARTPVEAGHGDSER